MRIFRSLLAFPGVIALAFVLSVFYANPSFADFGRKVVGSYLLRQDDGFLQILTLMQKGTVISQNNGQFLGANQFGDQQGAWRRAAGKGKVVITTLDFTFDTVKEVFTGFGRSTFDVRFEKGFDKLFGTVLVEIFRPSQDPLDPQAIPIQIFGPTDFTGKRIKAK